MTASKLSMPIWARGDIAKLDPEQLALVRAYFVEHLTREMASDKPFGTDEHPGHLTRLLGATEPLEWEHVNVLFSVLFLEEP